MALRGIRATAIEKRLKVFFYGISGSGKTTTAIHFPKPYLIDCERGSENQQYAELIEAQEGRVFRTADFEELIKEVKSLLSEKHDYKTLIIDPLTLVYNNLLDKYSLDKTIGAGFGRHYGEAAKDMKRLCDLILRLDMNVIITSHAKNSYGENQILIGQTYDCYNKLDYLFDLVIETQKRGENKVGVVKKTRIKSFIENEVFPLSYENFAAKYGKGILEKETVPQELAKKEDVEEMNRLIKSLPLTEDYINKKLKEANSASLEEMPRELMSKWISYLQSKEIKE